MREREREGGGGGMKNKIKLEACQSYTLRHPSIMRSHS